MLTEDFYAIWLVVYVVLLRCIDSKLKDKVHQQYLRITVGAVIASISSGFLLTFGLAVACVLYYIGSRRVPSGLPRTLYIWLIPKLSLFYALPFAMKRLSNVNMGVELDVSYSHWAVISFALTEVEGRGRCDALADLLEYHFYLPYRSLLIMPYPLFRRRLHGRKKNKATYKSLLVMSLRIVFAGAVRELMAHLCFVHAAFQALKQIPESYMSHRGAYWSLPAYQALVFFLRYVVLFGVQSVAAAADGMAPLDPPACVARISDATKMWRSFDRGLYQWLKIHVYMPIASVNFSVKRKLLATLASFYVVGVWHDWARSDTRQFILSNLFVVLSINIAKSVVANGGALGDTWHRLSHSCRRCIRSICMIPLSLVSWIGSASLMTGSAEIGWSMAEVATGIDSLWTLFVTLLCAFVFCHADSYMEDHYDRKCGKPEKQVGMKIEGTDGLWKNEATVAQKGRDGEIRKRTNLKIPTN